MGAIVLSFACFFIGVAGCLFGEKFGIQVPGKYKKLIFIVLAGGVAISAIDALAADNVLQSLIRPKWGNGAEEKEMEVQGQSGEWEKITVSVGEQKLKKKQAKEAIRQAKKEIDASFPKENPSLDEVTSDLDVKSSYVSGKVSASWTFEPYGIVDLDGTLHLLDVETNTIISASVTLECEDVTEIYQFSFQVTLPKENTPERYAYELEKKLQQLDQKDPTEEEMKLPESVGGKTITFREMRKNRGIEVSLVGILIAAGLIYGTKEDERKKEKERQKALSRDYPDILSKLSLYVGAGLAVKAAFTKIALQYRKDRESGRSEVRPGYEGVVQLVRKMEDGQGELASYEEFGASLRHKKYRKLSLMLVQNLRKGQKELIQQLEREEQEAFEERKLTAKIAGEEASTKLLLPMMGLLAVVLVVLIYPAMQSIQF